MVAARVTVIQLVVHSVRLHGRGELSLPRHHRIYAVAGSAATSRVPPSSAATSRYITGTT